MKYRYMLLYHRIKFNNDTCIDVFLFILLVFLTNNDIGRISQILYWGVVVGCCGMLLIQSFNKSINIKNSIFIMWYGVFLLYSIFSYNYTIDTQASLIAIKGLIVNLIVLLSVASVARSKERIDRIIKVLLLSIIFNTVYLIIKIDWISVGLDRIGVQYTGENWNANSIGMLMIWGIICSLYFYNKWHNKKYIFIISLLLPLLLFSGSRKAWISLILIICMQIIINNKKRMIKSILIIAFASWILFYATMNIDWLYEIIGHRIEELLNGFWGISDYDSSAYKRLTYIELGLKWFKEKPLLGYGINAYRRLLVSSYLNEYTYAHNNYVELLVDVGIIGTVIFYSMYIKTFLVFIKYVLKEFKVNREINVTALLFTNVIIIDLIMQFGMVSYTNILNLLLFFIMHKFLQKEKLSMSLSSG